jgi:hypothetical protein
VTRIVVSGARGFFGAHVVGLLRSMGHMPTEASRRPGRDVVLDVEDRASIRSVCRPGDVIVDATAPFQRRTTALVESAVTVGCDVVDLCDALAYARRVAAFDEAASASGIAVLNCCSAVSVLSALAIGRSGIREPAAVHGFLAPAARYTANPGVTQSFLSSVGRRIDVWRDGRWQHARGWRDERVFPRLRRTGRLVEAADSATLPRAFPSLKDVDFWIDPNVRGAAAWLSLACRLPALVTLTERVIRRAGVLAKVLGRQDGILAYEVEGQTASNTVVVGGPDAYLTAAIPAAVAASRVARGLRPPAGVVPVDRQVPGDVMFAALEERGFTLTIAPSG